MAQRLGRVTLALGLMIAGCSMSNEITPPAPGNIAELHRPTSPNSYLAAPATFILPPDVKTHLYHVAPDRLFATVREVIMAQPRTTALAVDADRLRVDHVVRSRVFRFPDVVLTQVLRTPDGSSELVLYSYSLKGYYDFGVNRDRVRTLLSALDAALGQSS